MPQRKTVPSLFKCSALATCRLVRDAVCSEARLSELDTFDEETTRTVARRIDEKCSAIAQLLKSKLPRALLTDLANVYLPKLCDPPDSLQCLNQTLEALCALCAFLKCGLCEVSFSEFCQVTNGTCESRERYTLLWSLFSGIVTSPDFFVNLERLQFSWLLREISQDEVFAAIAEHGKELLHLDLSDTGLDTHNFRRFVPEANEMGAFVGSVPCPKLETFKIHNDPEASTTIVDFLLSHYALSSFRCQGLDRATLNMFIRKVLQMRSACGEWKSGLTHAYIDADERNAGNDGSPSARDSVSCLNRFFPEVTILQASLRESELLELIPLMHRLQDLELNLGECDPERIPSFVHDPLGSNAVTLLSSYGKKLTTLRINCSSLFISQLASIDQGCPNVASFSLDVWNLAAGGTQGPSDFDLFGNLKEFVFSVYEITESNDDAHSWSLSDALRILLKNKPRLEQVTVLFGGENVTDDFISEWVTEGWTPNVREVSFRCGGTYPDEPSTFPLTDVALTHLMTLPKISRIGKLRLWSIEELTVQAHREALESAAVDLELVWEWDRREYFRTHDVE